MVKRDNKFRTLSSLMLLGGIVVIILAIYMLYLAHDIAQLSQHTQKLGGSVSTEDGVPNFIFAALILLMGCSLLALSLLFGKFAYRRNRLRQLAAQGDVHEVTLAPEQPVPDAEALNLPATIRWRLRPSFAMIWCLFLAFGGPIIVGGMLSPKEGFASPYGASLVNILALLFAMIGMIHLSFFCLMRRRVVVSEVGLVIHQHDTQRIMRWEDIHLFAYVFRDTYQISSDKQIFEWLNERDRASSQWISELLATPEEMDAFRSLVAAKTGLQLYHI